jgi:hypothetical protein
MKQNWSTLRKLGLVFPDPHLILRGKDDQGRTIFVAILTWTDHETPDHVSPEVQTIWNKLETLVENRGRIAASNSLNSRSSRRLRGCLRDRLRRPKWPRYTRCRPRLVQWTSLSRAAIIGFEAGHGRQLRARSDAYDLP